MIRPVDALRKLIDKTPKVEVTIIDKSPIPSSRGLATFSQDSIYRKDIEAAYTMEQIIDNVNGPIIHEIGSEDPFDHVARITGMIDPEFTTLSITLKPNGIFD